MEIQDAIAQSALFIAGFMSIWWMVSVLMKDASIADVVWGLGFSSLVLYLWSINDDIGVLQLVVSVPMFVWGVRLALHIGTRKWGKPEDWRYVNMREKAGEKFWWFSFFSVFMLQGLFMLIISAPLIVASSSAESATLSNPTILGGLAIWTIGFIFEVIGDIQLRRFLRSRRKKGAVLNSGLWRYTRHPNYFGEAMMWWGLALVVVTLDNGYAAFLSPLLITFLLTKISGVKMLEKKHKQNKAYQDYIKSTNSFFPGRPKKV